MLVNIDAEALRQEQSQLKRRLVEISALLSLTETKQQTSTQKPAEEVTLPILPQNGMRNRRFRQGVQRDIILALNTGPATETELIKVLTPAWTDSQIVTALRTIFDRRLGFRRETGHLQLSDTGKTLAKWFNENPSKKVHR